MSEETVTEQTAKSTQNIWIILSVALLGQMAATMASQGFPAVYPFIQNDLALSRAEVGLLTSALNGGGIVTVLVAGWFTDWLGVRRVLSIVLIAMSLILASFLYVNTFASVVILTLLIGALEGPAYPATSRAVMDWMPNRIRALAMSLKQTGVPLGGAIAATLLPVIAVAFGWRVACAAVGIPVLCIAFAVFIFYRDFLQNKSVTHPIASLSLKIFSHNRDLTIATIWGVIFTGIQFSVLSYLALYVVETFHVSPIVAGSMLAVAQVGSIIARISWGATSDFLLRGRRAMTLFTLGLLGAAALFGTSVMNLDTPWPVVFFAALLIGVTTLSWHGVFTAYIGELSNAGQIATTIGAVNTLMRVTMIIMPPLFGFLVDLNGSYSVAWVVFAVLAAASTLALLITAETRLGKLKGSCG